MKKVTVFSFFILCLFSKPEALPAYTEEILVPVQEVWDATKEVFAKPGFRKIDWDKKIMETKWTYDTVTRKRGMLKKVASGLYDRRYRIKIHFKPIVNATTLTITGVFQERAKGLAPGAPWNTYKLQTQDYDAERDAFFKILYALEKKRREPQKPQPAF